MLENDARKSSVMQEVLIKLASLQATQEATLAAVIEQRDALQVHEKQDHDDFQSIHIRVNGIERKQSWFIGAWSVVVVLVVGSVAFLRSTIFIMWTRFWQRIVCMRVQKVNDPLPQTASKKLSG